MLLSLALVLASCPPAVTAPRYPIDPVGLRSLLREAELVLVAQVEPAADSADETLAFMAGGATKLHVVQTLKGTAPIGSVVRVLVASGMMCPAPAHYPAGETVLAFLNHWEGDPVGDYRTVALSYGSKSLPPRELAVYLDRIRELQAVPDPEDADAHQAALAEWITRVLEQPVTREEGLIDLERDKGFVRKLGELPLSVDLLDELQAGRLLDALKADSSGDYTWSRFLLQLEDVRDPRLDRILVARLWSLSGEWQSTAQYEAMRILAKRLEDEGLKALVRQLVALRGPTDEVGAEKHRIVTAFLAACAERHPFLTDG